MGQIILARSSGIRASKFCFLMSIRLISYKIRGLMGWLKRKKCKI